MLDMKPQGFWTISSAKAWLRTKMEDGAQCPCCEQNVKVYKRKLSKSHVQTMMEVLKRQTSQDGKWVYVPDIPQKSRDFATAQYFGLIEQMPGEREDGAKQTGWWSVTIKGVRFLQGEEMIIKYAHVYNGEVIEYSGMNGVDVGDVWGEYFNFREMLGVSNG